MKSSDSTEMDRLLRRYVRRGGEALRAKTDLMAEANIGAHLDADEMNAYAEGALPEAARSRYFAHLADCDNCRKLVTELTLAASLADEGKARVATLESTPSKSWRERLAAILSPPVLRYAVPALALFAVVIVAIVAMRTNRKESGVALNVDQSRYSAPSTAPDSNQAAETQTTTGTAGSHASSNVAPLDEQQSQSQPGAAAAPPPSATPAPMEDRAPVVSQSTIPQTETAQSNDPKTTSGEFGIITKREQQEVAAAAAPPPAPKATGTATTGESDIAGRDKREDEQKKNKVAGKDDNDEMVVGGTNTGGTVAKQRVANEARPETGRTASTRAARSEPRNRPSAPTKSGPAAADMMAEKDSSSVTRNVGGRSFRRQGSAWVDTAYNSSRRTTNVARGSEQYRALVADEPTLRTIAEQLGGEVLVVWKSRAYRFY